MKTKLLGLALFLATVASVAYYPQLMARNIPVPPIDTPVANSDKAKIDVVFVLDTTGSMDGLIETAKEKIWSIATTMSSAQQSPEIRIGLVAFRDRGEEYVTKIVPLSDDLDSVYAALMDFEAAGGGDTPESVNKALYDAVHNMAWSQQEQAYQVIFLVGDAPPHMDYNEVRYPEIIASANAKGIVVNSIQCGEMASAVAPWTQIASLGGGTYFQVEQAGSAVAYVTPFDQEIADLSAELDDTRLYYGSEDMKDEMRAKVAATDKLHEGASVASRARRGVYNVSESGRTNRLGKNELVAAVASGAIDLNDIEAEALPEPMADMPLEEKKRFVSNLAGKRDDLLQKIQVLSKDRDGYLAEKVEEAGGFEDSLDRQLYDAVKKQAKAVGLEYEDGPAY